MSNLSPELIEQARQAAETLEQFQKTMLSLNDTPAPDQQVPGVGAGVIEHRTTRAMTGGEMIALRRELRKKSIEELTYLFGVQAAQQDSGIPLAQWLAAAGTGATDTFNGISTQVTPDVRRAIDTGGAAALIRQDLEPLLYELYVRQFPAFDRFAKEPANGLTHTFNQITDYGDAEFMGELGTVTDDKSTYVRQTTPVAILATRRGVSLKSQFAIPAGGMGYNIEQLELQGGLRSMAHKMQQTIFGGQGTDSGGTAANELGLYDANGFTGVRSILNTARAKNVDPATNPDTAGNIRRAVDDAVVEIVQAGGGMPSIIWSHPTEKNTFNEQQDDKTRIIVPDNVEIAVGTTAGRVNTIAGAVPWAIVPGDSIDDYVTTSADGAFSGGETVRDIYLLDESTFSLPFLGSAGPTVLDIPIGISGQLVRLMIIFGMWGLAAKAPQFSNKVRVKI